MCALAFPQWEVTRCDPSRRFRLATAISTESYATWYCQRTPAFSAPPCNRLPPLPKLCPTIIKKLMSTVSQGASGSTAHIELKPALGPPAVSRNYPAPQQYDKQKSQRPEPHDNHTFPTFPGRRVSYRPGQPWGHELCVLAFLQEIVCCECGSSRQFRLALNLTPCYQRTPRVFGSSLQPASFLPGDPTLSSPGNPCPPFPKELRVRLHTLDLDLLSDNRRWAETTRRRYPQNNQYPVKSGD